MRFHIQTTIFQKSDLTIYSSIVKEIMENVDRNYKQVLQYTESLL